MRWEKPNFLGTKRPLSTPIPTCVVVVAADRTGRPMDRPVAFPCTLQGASLQYIRSSVRLASWISCMHESASTQLTRHCCCFCKETVKRYGMQHGSTVPRLDAWMASNAISCSVVWTSGADPDERGRRSTQRRAERASPS